MAIAGVGDVEGDAREPRGEPAGWLIGAASVAWRALVVGAALSVVALAVDEVGVVVFPLLLSTILAAVLWPAVDWLADHRVPRGLASAGCVLGVVVAVAGLIAPLVVLVGLRRRELVGSLADAWAQLRGWLGHLPVVGSTIGEETSAASLADFFQDHVGAIGSQLAASVGTTATVATGFGLTTILLFFFLKDGRGLRDWAVQRWPGERRWEGWRPVAQEVWTALGRYMRGLGLVALINSLLQGLLLFLIGVPHVGTIMALTFVGSFIPFVGPIASTAVAVVLGLTKGGLLTALGAILVGVGVQAVEGNVLHPWLLGRTMRLHPVVILVGVVVGAKAWGIPGAFLAIPALTVAAILIDRGREREA